MTVHQTLSSRQLLWTIFLVGLILQGFLFWRSWLSNDQVILLNLGLDLARHGNWQPVAKGMSGSGHIPGCLLQLLVGLPLLIKSSFRSPNVLVFLFHLAAVVLLLDVVRKALGEKIAVVFLGLYWLSPWRLYHAGFLWEPSFLYLPAALHLWACWRLRLRPAFGASVVVGLVLTATLQLHASFLILLILTVILVLRRLIKFNYAGLVCGLLVGGLTLWPTMVAFFQGTLPPVAPQNGFIGRGLVLVFPVLKSVLYWIRFISLDAGGIIKETVFTSKEWAAQGLLQQGITYGVKSFYILTTISAVLCGWAAWVFFRSAGRDAHGVEDEQLHWIRWYLISALLAMLIAVGLSPVTTQGWHVIIILPVACISGSWWLQRKWSDGRAVFRWAIIGLIALRIPLAVIFGLGHSRYRPAPVTETIAADLITVELLEILPEQYRPLGNSDPSIQSE